MSTDIKLSKVQLSKIIQSAGFVGKTLGNMMGNIGKKKKHYQSLPFLWLKMFFPKLTNKATSFILDKFEEKNIVEKGP